MAKLELGHCPKGDRCPKSHNKVEQLYRHDKYKKKFCPTYPDHLEECLYGRKEVTQGSFVPSLTARMRSRQS
jgi:hypothetical protein